MKSHEPPAFDAARDIDGGEAAKRPHHAQDRECGGDGVERDGGPADGREGHEQGRQQEVAAIASRDTRQLATVEDHVEHERPGCERRPEGHGEAKLGAVDGHEDGGKHEQGPRRPAQARWAHVLLAPGRVGGAHMAGCGGACVLRARRCEMPACLGLPLRVAQVARVRPRHVMPPVLGESPSCPRLPTNAYRPPIRSHTCYLSELRKTRDSLLSCGFV